MSTDVFNGVALEDVWDCGGYRFWKSREYRYLLDELPSSRPGKAGKHVATFHAEGVDNESSRPSRWITGATSLDEVVALWSFVSGMPVHIEPIRRGPTANERFYAFGEPHEIVAAITESYSICRRRPRSRKVISAFLTYLEIAHIGPLQIKAVLVTSVLECLAPIRTPSKNVRADDESPRRYTPIVKSLCALPVIVNVGVPPWAIERLVVLLYRVRNGFLHGGIHPFETELAFGSVMITTSIAVNAARMLAKFAVAEAMAVPITKSEQLLCRKLLNLVENGTFISQKEKRFMQLFEGTATP